MYPDARSSEKQTDGARSSKKQADGARSSEKQADDALSPGKQADGAFSSEKHIDDACPDQKSGYTPLMIDLSGRKIVIFGGGAVGERKALRFMKTADVFVYSSSFTEGLKEAAATDPGHLHLIPTGKKADNGDPKEADSFAEKCIEGAFLVIPATGDIPFNERLAAIARRMNCLVNSVDGASEVMIPSSVEKGGLLISISSMGTSPAITKHARILIESVITDDFEKMMHLQEELRSHLKETVPDQKVRQEILRKVVSSDEVRDALSVSYENGKKKAEEICGFLFRRTSEIFFNRPSCLTRKQDGRLIRK